MNTKFPLRMASFNELESARVVEANRRRLAAKPAIAKVARKSVEAVPTSLYFVRTNNGLVQVIVSDGAFNPKDAKHGRGLQLIAQSLYPSRDAAIAAEAKIRTRFERLHVGGNWFKAKLWKEVQAANMY